MTDTSISQRVTSLLQGWVLIGKRSTPWSRCRTWKNTHLSSVRLSRICYSLQQGIFGRWSWWEMKELALRKQNIARGPVSHRESIEDGAEHRDDSWIMSQNQASGQTPSLLADFSGPDITVATKSDLMVMKLAHSATYYHWENRSSGTSAEWIHKPSKHSSHIIIWFCDYDL